MSNCAVHGCHATSENEDFFKVPDVQGEINTAKYRITSARQSLWLEAILGKPPPKTVSAYDKKIHERIKASGQVCPKHFKHAKPADDYDVQAIDWLPTVLINFKALNKDKVAKIKADLVASQEELHPKSPPKKTQSPKKPFIIPPITRMTTRRSLKAHLENKDENLEPIQPTTNVETIFLPEMPIDLPEVNKDQKAVSRVRFKCGAPSCGFAFDSLDAVKLHLRTTHSVKKPDESANKIKKCGMCKEQFSSFEAVIEHLNKVHGARSDEVKRRTVVAGNPVIPIKDAGQARIEDLMDRLKTFDWCQCLECDQHFESFLEHVLRVHNRETKPTTLASFSEKNIPIKLETPAVNIEKSPLKFENSPPPMNVDDEIGFEDAPPSPVPKDEYFESEDINLAPAKTTTAVNRKRSTSVEIVDDVSQSPAAFVKPKKPSKPLNTSRRVFFKVQKDKHNKKTYTCTACKKDNVFSDYNDVTAHFKLHYAKTNVSPNTKIAIKPLIRDESGNKSIVDLVEYQCALCDSIFGSKASALNCIEMHRHNGWLDAVASKEEPTLDIQVVGSEIEIDSGQPLLFVDNSDVDESDLPPRIDACTFQCGKCKLMFFSHSQIYDHVKKMHDPSYQVRAVEEVTVQHNLRCQVCYLEFKLAEIDLATAHRREQHKFSVVYNDTNITRYLVTADGQASQMFDDLAYYKKDCIADSFTCICGKMFSDRDLVDFCYGQHTGHKQYKCERDACRYAFYTRSDLRQHIGRTHDIDPEQMQICDMCGLMVHKNNIRQHMLTHGRQKTKTKSKSHPEVDSYKCKTCEKVFVSVTGLRAHVKVVHKKEKRFQCDVCYKRFIYRTNAEYCEARHKGVKGFGCIECNRKFYTKRQADRHMLHHINSRLKQCSRCAFVGKTLTEMQQHKSQCTWGDENIMDQESAK